MSLEKLELLEARLNRVIQLVEDLREKNASLEKQVESLKKELAAKQSELAKYHEKRKTLSLLEGESQQLLEERERIRAKIESMLDNLERIDIM